MVETIFSCNLVVFFRFFSCNFVIRQESEASSLTSPVGNLVEERPSKRKGGDKLGCWVGERPKRKAEIPETKTQKGEGILEAKRSKERKQNPFLCVIQSCERVVTAEVFGFSRETALLEHYNMHLKKGETPKFPASSLLDFCSCGWIKLKAQACRACG